MITDFDKQFLKEEIFKDLLQRQHWFERPNLIGLTQLDNCMCETALYDFVKRELNFGNTQGAYRAFKYYQQRFAQYLSLLGEDENIYPSKELLLSQLFINGEYKFLNFSSNDISKTRYINNGDDVTIITLFSVRDFDNIQHERRSESVINTRIKKGNVIRFYSKELTHEEHFNDNSCYLTLTSDGITDDEFNNTFKASNYRTETMSIQEPVEFKVHNLIKKMVQLGKEFTQDNPTNEDHKPRRPNYSGKADVRIILKDLMGKYISLNFPYMEENYPVMEVGLKIVFDNAEYIIREIKSEEKVKHILIIEKVG